MPALSENLTFAINSTTNSVQLTYPTTATTALSYTSNKIKGAGYFGNSSGLHTAFWSVLNFVGSISVQGSIATDPSERDWITVRPNISLNSNGFTLDTTGGVVVNTQNYNYTSAVTTSQTFNFVGNFVWIRGKVDKWSAGTVENISINR